MSATNGTPVCPANPVWLRKMLEVLPPGLRGKLEPYSECPAARKPGESKVIRPILIKR